MSNAFFITATGTEIGKTYVSASLLQAARDAGRSVSAIKPLMSGFDPDNLLASDAGQLLKACGREATPENVNAICLHSFTPPLAPNVAARQAGVALDDDALTAFCEDGLSRAADLCLVEGAGGVLSPATDSMLQADLAARLKLPAILITADYLGTVSHTLSAMEALDRRGVPVSAVVVSEPSPGAAPDEMEAELARWRPEAVFLTAHYQDAGIGARLLRQIAA